MIPAALARRLTQPRFQEADFIPTEFYPGEDQAAFANDLMRFLAQDCPQGRFTKFLYRRLSNSFGHIAHYNRHSFFSYFFSDTASRISFLEETLAWPYTFVDVERAVAARLRESGLLLALRAQRVVEIGVAERALLLRLKAKYEPADEPDAAPPGPGSPRVPQRDLFGLSQRG